MESLFNKTGCDSTTITDMLGGQSGVANSNVLQYMGIIEQRANELLQLNAFVQAKESDDPAAMATFLQGRAPKHTQGPLSVQPPSSKWVCLLASVHIPTVDIHAHVTLWPVIMLVTVRVTLVCDTHGYSTTWQTSLDGISDLHPVEMTTTQIFPLKTRASH